MGTGKMEQFSVVLKIVAAYTIVAIQIAGVMSSLKYVRTINCFNTMCSSNFYFVIIEKTWTKHKKYGYYRILEPHDILLLQCARVASSLKFVGPIIPSDSTGDHIQ